MVLLCHFQAGNAALDLAGFSSGRFRCLSLFRSVRLFDHTEFCFRRKSKPAYFRNFYARRTLRIFPLYYGVLALQFWVLLPIFPTPHTLADAHYQGWLWAYGYNILTAVKGHYFFSSDWMGLGHFWSLAVEEQFYLVWPFIVLVLCRETY